MKRIARKVTLGKWRNADWAGLDRIPADAISLDLKTTGNCLSFWSAGNDASGEQAAILAVLGTLQRIETIDIAFIDGDCISGAEFEATEGATVVSELRGLHLDIRDVDANVLSKTAFELARSVYGKEATRLTKSQFKSKMQEALNAGKIDWNSLHETMRADLVEPTLS